MTKIWVNDRKSNLGVRSSASKAVESSPLPLESVDDVHGSDSLPLGVLGVGHSVTDDILQEYQPPDVLMS